MAVIRWDPWGELSALQRDVNELFGRAWGTQRRTLAILPIDAYRTETGLCVQMELPGMRLEDIDVSVHDGQLIISGERQAEEKVEDERWVRRERSYGRFQRGFTLPEGVDAAQITATLENGVLKLSIPNPPERQPQKIQIGGQSTGKQTAEVTETMPTSGQ
jgi:HSP20 family protein